MKRSRRSCLLLAASGLAALSFPVARAATSPWAALSVTAAAGTGTLPVLASLPFDAAEPTVARVVIVVPGKARDAAQYDLIARQAQHDAGAAGQDAMLVVPLFPEPNDSTLPPASGTTAPELSWSGIGWASGGLADGPAPLSSFDALDALVAHFSDRTRYPALREIVLAGHSAGGQLVQRYAELRAAEQPAGAPTLRFVVANPSSYGYFTAERPVADAAGGIRFAPFAGAAACPTFNDWKYGMDNLPAAAGSATSAQIESRYAGRTVTYLLGALDNDPTLEALDKSCAAEAQGPTHLTRGQNFFHYLLQRHPTGLNQVLSVIPGAEHDPAAMFLSPCGLSALFGTAGCATATVPPAPGPATPVAAPAPAPATARPASPALRHHPEPPPRRAEHHPRLHPGTVWEPGYWDWNGSTYVWIPGSVHVISGRRPVLVPGHWRWSWNGLGWVWVAPHYR